MNDQLLQLRQAARQIAFRTGINTTPVTIGGTYFLVAYHERLFAVTAKHVIGNAVPEQLLLDTSDHTWIPARVLEQFNSSDECTGELDLVVYDLDTRHFTAKHRSKSRAYNMPPRESNWISKRYECGFFLFGYPLHRATVDYGALTTQARREQWFVSALYHAPSELPNCHALKMVGPLGLSNLDGLSGSPVFAYQTAIGKKAQPSFAGIALRGTAASGLVHFLEERAVRAVLNQILQRPRRSLPKKWRSLKTKARRSPVKHQ
jgi:hypothetical protein